MIKRFSIIKVKKESDIYYGKRGVIVTISKVSNYPYRVCFGCDKFDNGIIGIYCEKDLEILE